MLKPRPVTIHRINFLDAIISAGADRSAALLPHHSIIKTLTVGNFVDSRHLLTFPRNPRCFGTGLAMIVLRRGDESSEERNSVLGNIGSNWDHPIGSCSSASR